MLVFICLKFTETSGRIPVDTGRKLNVHKTLTFYVRSIYVLCLLGQYFDNITEFLLAIFVENFENALMSQFIPS